MSLRNEYQKLVTLSNCNASGENLLDATAAASNVLFLLQESSKVTKVAIHANFESSQRLKIPAAKSVAPTLAQAISSRYQSQGIREVCSHGNAKAIELKDEVLDSNVPSFLPVLSRLMINWPDLESFREIVGQIALLHFFDPVLFSLLCNEFKYNDPSVQSTLQSSDFYQEPDWWKRIYESFISKQSHTKSPLEYLYCLKGDALCQLKALSKVTVKTLNAGVSIHSKLISAVSLSVSSILELLLNDSPMNDSVLMIICQQKDLVEKIQSLSILSVDVVKSQATTILECLVNRQTAVTVYGVLHSFGGAQRLLNLYSQKQRSAYEFIARTPFIFVLDFLDQANSSSEQTKPIHATFIGIASQKIAALCSDQKGLFVLYEGFNRTSKVQSMFFVLCSFVIETVSFNFQMRRDGQSLNVLKLILAEFGNSLPPLAKPNYFFVDRRPPKMPGDVIAFELSLDTADLNISVRLILYSLRKVIKLEISEALEVTTDEKLVKKIGSRALRLIFCSFFAVLFCQPESNDNGANKSHCVEEIGKISRIVADCCKRHGSLFYMALFNFANDVCHAYTDALPNIFEMVKIVIESSDPLDQTDFVKSAIESLEFTFGCSVNKNLNSDVYEVRVAQAEYCSLYGKNKQDKNAYINYK